MSHEKIHTLLLTQDQTWLDLLYRPLWHNGFAPLTVVPTSEGTLDLCQQVTPRLLLIDLNLPDCDVVDLCIETLQIQPSVKVVLLADAAVEPPLAAIHAGVVGCIHSDLPSSALPSLLVYLLNGGVAFQHNLIERVLAAPQSKQKDHSLVTLGKLQIDQVQHVVLYAGRQVRLTPREFALLSCLVRNTDRVITFDQLLNDAWGFDTDNGTPAQVRLYVARLRRKLMQEAQTPDFIITERGFGYRLQSSILHRSVLHSDVLHRAITPLPELPVHHHLRAHATYIAA